MKKRKTQTAWAITDASDNYIWTQFIRDTRRACIAAWREGDETDWKTWRAEGRRCVRVTITVDPVKREG